MTGEKTKETTGEFDITVTRADGTKNKVFSGKVDDGEFGDEQT